METLYELRLRGGKWYVGTTAKPVEQRVAEHAARNGQGALWTQLHGVVCLEKSQRVDTPCKTGEETRRTAELMMIYGVQNVRGGPWTATRPFTTDDLGELVRGLGHSLGLDYADVKELVEPQLQPSRSRDRATPSRPAHARHNSFSPVVSPPKRSRTDAGPQYGSFRQPYSRRENWSGHSLGLDYADVGGLVEPQLQPSRSRDRATPSRPAHARHNSFSPVVVSPPKRWRTDAGPQYGSFRQPYSRRENWSPDHSCSSTDSSRSSSDSSSSSSDSSSSSSDLSSSSSDLSSFSSGEWDAP
eukprot:gnl/Spiro4/15661_TR8417_c0_g1_i3.p1 gnl/Spiro4/15661_TR8417_c0_g1~~gnl/Spiro4/15661_TR8417_c0_g1_i3.p1  ORF type:complete len:300 (-),score=42.89 gnl/Spiro4/15661_TR8417_c0_g1_i3:151-1050(-)